MSKIGEEKYDGHVDTLKKLDQYEQAKGKFVYQKEDIDTRPADKKDLAMHVGFSTVCGYKGTRLSGG